MPAPAQRQRAVRGDVLDILLIDTLWELNYSETADAALRVFEERATHAFPPAFIMPRRHPELETFAGRTRLPDQDLCRDRKALPRNHS
jgi:hypothetical protein